MTRKDTKEVVRMESGQNYMNIRVPLQKCRNLWAIGSGVLNARDSKDPSAWRPGN
jgi:hypothetical protein